MSRSSIPDLISLDLVIDLKSWQKIRGLKSRVMKAANAIVPLLPARLRIPATATLLLTGDAYMRRLNHQFRGMDKATNVLSFPARDERLIEKKGRLSPPIMLGDIALGYQYIVNESKNNNYILINHVSHMVIHGLLHLFGYDHDNEKDAEIMEKLEIRAMSTLGYHNPYSMDESAVMATDRYSSSKAARRVRI